MSGAPAGRGPGQAALGLRLGQGAAHGAVTVLNATATGIGCALATAAGATATWRPGPTPHLVAPGDGRLARAVAATCADLLGGRGGQAAATCAFPPSRGLKTSSSAAAALVRAAAASAGRRLPDAEVERRAVDASRRAGVTLTGALDDQAAVVRGGCHLTDNRSDAVLASLPVPAWHVAAWVPAAAIPKADAARADVAGLADACHAAEALARAGRIPEAMTANGAAFLAAYRAAGLPVDGRPVHAALAAGALGAGLSGTGPAVAALFDAPRPLPPVPGGAWAWTRVVP